MNPAPLSLDPASLLIPGLGSFLLAVLAFPLYIRWLKIKAIGQFIREEGPASHAAKAKTPTMGGLCFMAVSCLMSLIVLSTSNLTSRRPAAVVLMVGVCCGLVGLADDFFKLTFRSNRGLSARSRLVTEFTLGVLLSLSLFLLGVPVEEVVLKFKHLSGSPVMMPVFIDWPDLAGICYALLLIPFLVAACSNAVNLHDGMDGLAAGTSLQIFMVLSFIFYASGNPSLAVVSSAVAGSLAAFLLFNRYPASVFMGDTGSLFIGGVMAALVAASGLTLWFIPLSLIYIIETLSVVAQVVYFKLTKEYQSEKPLGKLALVWLKLTRRLPGEGKRLLKMAPLHHHFEAVAAEQGQPEWKVVACFWLVQFLLCAVVVAAICLS